MGVKNNTNLSDVVSETILAESANTEDTSVDNTVNEETTKKKNTKKLIIILSSCVATAIIIVGVVLFFILTAKSEEATRVDNVISEIGTVTLESEEKIIKAEKEVEALEEEDYKQLDNLEVLQNARKTYTELINQEEINVVIRFINDIGEVTLDSESKINSAQKRYDDLDDELKSEVTNYNVLEEAKSKYSQLRADNVMSLIDAIGTVTINSKDAIEAAEKAYKDLSIKEKDLVTNYLTLVVARNSLTTAQENQAKKQAEEKEKAKKDALSKLVADYDEVQEVTFYYASVQPEYIDERCFALPYLAISDSGNAWLCLMTNYTGEDWIFYDELLIKTDDKKYTRDFEYFDIEHDNDNGVVWEVYNEPAKDSDINWLKDVSNSNNAIIRFQSDDKCYDLTVSDSDKNAIKQVLNAYEIAK